VPDLLRVFLIGLGPGDLGALQARSAGDQGFEIAGAARLTEIERGTVRLPASIDAIVMSPEAWAATAASPPRPREPGEHLIEELTARERDVLALVADGCPNREIALRLGVSEHTVKFHLASIYGKLGVSTRTQAVRRALEWGVIAI
jgi:DNA-binding NarL/FixJ family response regulator